MAKGTRVFHYSDSKSLNRVGRLNGIPPRFNKIAVQFSDSEFAEINAQATDMGLSFAATVRYRIWGNMP